MNKELKLTEETLDLVFHGFTNDLGNNVGVYDTSKEEKIRDVEDELKQQILEDHKIVEALTKIESVVLPIDITPDDARFIRYDYIRNLIKKTTGKNIQEIHFQEAVKN